MTNETHDSTKMQKRRVDLFLEANPNPNSLKFVANFMLFTEDESYDYPNRESAEGESPIAVALFDFDYVSRVFLMNNFITVTKSENATWEDIRNDLKQFIKTYIESGKPLLLEQVIEEDTQEDTESVSRIKEILDEYVKPAVEMDGGAIIFESYVDGIVKLQLQGSCSGCPSSTLTLKAGIENLLKSMMPEIQGVEAESV